MSRLTTLLIASLTAACNATPPRSVVIRAGRLIDGSGAPAREKVVVRVTDGIIEAVEPDDDRPPPDGAAVVDARTLTLLPGLVDAHTHLFPSGSCDPRLGPGPLQAARNLHALLAGGVTTVADLGAPLALAVALRQHVGTGRHRGPRVFVAGPILTAPGGYPIDLLGPTAVPSGVVREVGSPAAAVAAVREVALAGVDVVKVALDERSYDGQPIPALSSDSLCAVVKEAKRQELRVLAHATTVAAYELALGCGVDGLVHGSLEPLDPDLVSRLAARDLPITPTLFVFEAQRAPEAAAVNLENTRKLHVAGVPLGLGTDASSCVDLLGSPIHELERLAQAGLTPLEVLAAASRGGARLLNLQDAVGLVQVGYRADLIAVRGRPDIDLADVTRVEWVLIDGVVQRLDTPGVGEELELLWRFMWAELLD